MKHHWLKSVEVKGKQMWECRHCRERWSHTTDVKAIRRTPCERG